MGVVRESFSRSFRQVLTPCPNDPARSITTRSNVWHDAHRSAASASATGSQSYPSRLKRRHIASRRLSSRSATRIRSVIAPERTVGVTAPSRCKASAVRRRGVGPQADVELTRLSLSVYRDRTLQTTQEKAGNLFARCGNHPCDAEPPVTGNPCRVQWC